MGTQQNNLAFSILLLLCFATILGLSSCQPDSTTSKTSTVIPPSPPEMRYGFLVDSFQIVDTTVQHNQFFGTLLNDLGLSYPETEQLLSNGREIFDPKIFRENKPLSILSKDTTDGADYLVYEPNKEEYIIFELKDSFTVERKQRPIEIRQSVASGLIESSLWNAMVNNGLSFELASKMEDALQWSIDFHHLQKGDKFKLVYDQKFIEGEPAGVEKVYAAYYKNYNNEYHAIQFDSTKHAGYYDYEGRPMNKSFLKSPVKYSRISSRYNLRRFHPIQKRVKPHYGTDYAAPHGTPIMSVGDGVVSRQGFTRGNGNFIKIKHNDTYSTQYLHMSKFARGVSKGVHVKQGQTIGYVGSTGLATGPHVCFRFWKEGRQINHLSLSFPPPEPMPESDLPKFYAARDSYLKLMENVTYQEFEVKEIEPIDTTSAIATEVAEEENEQRDTDR